MILFISARQPQIDGEVDERFGRSPWLVRYDTATDAWEAFPNPGASQSRDSGADAAKFVVDQKADAIISGDFGPHAVKALKAARIALHLFTYEVTTIQQAIDAYKQKKLPALKR